MRLLGRGELCLEDILVGLLGARARGSGSGSGSGSSLGGHCVGGDVDQRGPEGSKVQSECYGKKKETPLVMTREGGKGDRGRRRGQKTDEDGGRSGGEEKGQWPAGL